MCLVFLLLLFWLVLLFALFLLLLLFFWLLSLLMVRSLLVLFVVAVAVGAGALFLVKPSGLNKAPLPAPSNVQPKVIPPAP